MENRINKIHGQLIEDVRVPEIEKRVEQLEEGGQGGGNINLANVDVQYIQNYWSDGFNQGIRAIRVTSDLEFTEIADREEYATSIDNDIISGKNVAIMYSSNSYLTADIIKNNVEPNLENYFLGKGAKFSEPYIEIPGTQTMFTSHCYPLTTSEIITTSVGNFPHYLTLDVSQESERATVVVELKVFSA